LRLNSGACKNPDFFAPYLKKYSKRRYEIFTKNSPRFLLHMVEISALEAL